MPQVCYRTPLCHRPTPYPTTGATGAYPQTASEKPHCAGNCGSALPWKKAQKVEAWGIASLLHITWQYGSIALEKTKDTSRERYLPTENNLLWGHTCGFSDGTNTASKMPSHGKCLSESSEPQRSLKWQVLLQPNLGHSVASASPA